MYYCYCLAKIWSCRWSWSILLKMQFLLLSSDIVGSMRLTDLSTLWLRIMEITFITSRSLQILPTQLYCTRINVITIVYVTVLYSGLMSMSSAVTFKTQLPTSVAWTIKKEKIIHKKMTKILKNDSIVCELMWMWMFLAFLCFFNALQDAFVFFK